MAVSCQDVSGKGWLRLVLESALDSGIGILKEGNVIETIGISR